MLDKHDEKIKTALQDLAEQHIPSTLDGWKGVQARLPKAKMVHNKPLRLRMLSLLIVNAALILVAVVSVVWLTRPQQTISAAEIIQQAILAGEESTVTSYEATVKMQDPIESKVLYAEWHLWRKYPIQQRLEQYVPVEMANVPSIEPETALSKPTNPSDKLVQVIVNGASGSYYNYYGGTDIATCNMVCYPVNVSVQYEPPYDIDLINIWSRLDIPTGRFGRGRVDYFKRILAKKNSRDGIKYIGTQTVAGREVHAIEFPDIGYTSGYGFEKPLPKISHVLILIDRETLLQLGETWYGEDDKIIRTWEFTTIKINQVINDDVFNFKPPEGRLMLDESPMFRVSYQPNAPLMDAKHFDELLKEIEKQVNLPYQVFVPDKYVPMPKLMPAPPYYDFHQGGILTLKYQTPGNALALVILEGSPQVMAIYDPCNKNKCETIKIGEIEGYYHEFNDIRWLSFERDGTYILIRATQEQYYDPDVTFNQSDLISVAESLQPFEQK